MDYYPYGKTLRSYYSANGEEKFLTTHHERDQESGLDYRGARNYCSDVARFLSLDPAAAEYATLSDYVYVADNPVIFVDPDGRNYGQYVTTSGNIIGQDQNGDKDDKIHIVEQQSEIKKIRKNDKLGKFTHTNDVLGEVTTTLAIIKEAVNVLKRTDENGNIAEEVSVVSEGGEVSRGEKGPTPKKDDSHAHATTPSVPGSNNTLIHSHFTNLGLGFDGNALKPSIAYDLPVFLRYKQNVIVGRLGEAKRDENGKLVPNPYKGAAFYTRTGFRIGTMKLSALNRIIKKQ